MEILRDRREADNDQAIDHAGRESDCKELRDDHHLLDELLPRFWPHILRGANMSILEEERIDLRWRYSCCRRRRHFAVCYEGRTGRITP